MSEVLIQGINIKKSFPLKSGTLEVLKGITITIKKGEMVGIFGPSGSGKSTLLYILSGLDRPTEGEVFFAGQSLSLLTEEELFLFRNQKIGFLFQFHYLLPEFTALENVMLPLLIRDGKIPEIRRKAEAILVEVGVKERMEHKPEKLSGGEKQRVSLARALITDPLCLFLDEPTGNLDRESSENLLSLLSQLNQKKGTTMLLVSHNERVKEIVNKIYYLSDGKLYHEKV
jgi:ABC-type lipoprotein export system ATPase subunit|uniref:ABC transporter ATP-binding protein n=1 Tax=candidate division WOR-3 bacterium TaxID=2052148 RepID=A0A7C3URY2_UNCW3